MDRSRMRWGTLGPVVLILALLVLFLSKTGDPERSYAPLGAYFDYAQASVPINAVTPLPAAQLQVIQQSGTDRTTAQIDLVLEAELYRDQLALLGDELQTALDYAQARTTIRLLDRVNVIISQDSACGFHGVTYSDVRVIYIYSCAGIPRQRVVNIAAHEFVHQLEQDRYGPPHLSADLVLSEGFATWGAGNYWLGGNPDFASFARQYRDSGAALPLGTHYNSVGAGGMNVLYYEWAAFVEYLLTTYGRERFDTVYSSGGGQQPGTAQYETVYNRSFGLLEREWATWMATKR